MYGESMDIYKNTCKIDTNGNSLYGSGNSDRSSVTI